MSGPPTRPVPSLFRDGALLALAATAAAAQTEFPHAAGTDSSGRAQAVSDAAGRVLIESPEFPRGLWVDLVDEAGQELAGIQMEYEGSPDGLVAIWSADPSGLRQETLLWTRPGGDTLRLAVRLDNSSMAVDLDHPEAMERDHCGHTSGTSTVLRVLGN